MVLASHPIPLSCALRLIFLIPSHLFPSSGCPTLDKQATSQRMKATLHPSELPQRVLVFFQVTTVLATTVPFRSCCFQSMHLRVSHMTQRSALRRRTSCARYKLFSSFSFLFGSLPLPPLLRLHVLHAGDLSEPFVLWLRAVVTQQPKLSAFLWFVRYDVRDSPFLKSLAHFVLWVWGSRGSA